LGRDILPHIAAGMIPLGAGQMAIDIGRRQFISALGGASLTWPLAARAQQLDRIRHIGMLVGFDDPDLKAFQQELEKLGWSEGRNIHIDYRYAPAGAQVQTLAEELVAL
jgi:putative tryptophan/tyrosine transport system substrate-binding protein